MSELKTYYGNGLNYDNIDFSDYFRTLMFEAGRQNYIDGKKLKKIKDSLGELLALNIAEFTNYESTSVMNDTANGIFVSILYCLDVALFDASSHEEAVDFISEHDVNEVFIKGQNLIRRHIFECAGLIAKLKARRINFPDISYNLTLNSEIMEHLKKYDSKYYAHETKRIYSYRSVNGGGAYRGIIHTKKIIENLIFENSYVNKYDDDIIQNLCYGYCEANALEYNDMKTNIYSVVLLNELFNVIAGNQQNIELKKECANEVSKELKKYNLYEQRKIILSAGETLSSDPYVQRSVIKLCDHIINAVENNSLSKVVHIGSLD